MNNININVGGQFKNYINIYLIQSFFNNMVIFTSIRKYRVSTCMNLKVMITFYIKIIYL